MEKPQDISPQKSIQQRPDALREDAERLRWLIRIRWWAPAMIAAFAGLGILAGFELGFVKFVIVAAYVLGYNIWFYHRSPGFETESAAKIPDLHRSVHWQTAMDCSALFLLVYFSGGIASTVCFLFIMPIIIVSVLLSSRSAYGLAVFVLIGITILAFSEQLGWLPHQAIIFRQKVLVSRLNLQQTFFSLVVLSMIFLAAVFLTTQLADIYRNKSKAFEEHLRSVTALNQKLWRLFSMIQTIGSAQNLDQVLQVVTSESAAVMHVRGISIKLLSEDGKLLRYAAAHGLPEVFIKEKVIEVEKSSLNKRIIEGEPYVTGNVTAKEMFQFGEILAEAQIKSVLFLPLRLEGRVIGILGAYCIIPDRFSQEDVEFFRLVAALVAIALENARAYEAVEKLVQERSWYMLRVAHNLRAPLAGMLSILEAVRGEYLGGLNADQKEYLRRLDRRARTMLSMINELMTLAKSREERIIDRTTAVEPDLIAGRIQRTFQERAAEKSVHFNVIVSKDLPPIGGELEIIEQILENLVSNAIKYNRADGMVDVKFSRINNAIRIEISDTGIGIPKTDRPRLFSEFFRAENARAVEKTGTGLGLAIVKEFVDKLGGRILVESEEGMGTIFVVDLPIATIKNGGQYDSGGNT